MLRKIGRVAMWSMLFVAGLSNISSAVEWKWNGYFGAFYSDNNKPKSEGAFDTFALSLIPQMKLNDKASVRAQIFFEHGPLIEWEGGEEANPQNTGEIEMTDAYFTYTVSDLIGVRLGKFLSPYGIYNTLFYALPTFPTMKLPGEFSVYAPKYRGHDNEVTTNYPKFSNGLWLFGHKEIKELTLGYDLYVNNGRRITPGHQDDNTDKGIGGKLTLGLPLASLGFEKSDISYSGYMDEASNNNPVPDDTTTLLIDESVPATFSKQNFSLISADFTYKGLGFRGEVSFSQRGSTKMRSYYGLADYTIMEKITPFVGYSSFDPNTDSSSKTDQESVITAGINYQIIPWLTTVKFQVDSFTEEGGSTTKTALGYDSYTQFRLGVATAF